MTMSKIVMTQPLCAEGYEPLAKEGPHLCGK